MGLKIQRYTDYNKPELRDPKSNFRQSVELYDQYEYIATMSMRLRESFRSEKIAEDRRLGINLFTQHFPKDAYIFEESVVYGIPRAEIVKDDIGGLYFVERIRLHPAFWLTEEEQAAIRSEEGRRDVRVRAIHSGVHNAGCEHSELQRALF